MSNGSSGQMVSAMSSLMDRPGPSVPSHPIPNLGYKGLSMKPPMSSDLSVIDLNNPEEEDEFDDEDDEYPCDEASSMTDQGTLSPEGSGGPSFDWGETQAQRSLQQQQQQRQRTQMSHFQILQLRDFYRNHRTPNRHECEGLGQDLGLPHRVVQVWFR